MQYYLKQVYTELLNLRIAKIKRKKKNRINNESATKEVKKRVRF